MGVYVWFPGYTSCINRVNFLGSISHNSLTDITAGDTLAFNIGNTIGIEVAGRSLFVLESAAERY